MQFRLLGPLHVAEQNVAAAFGGVTQRSLLAIVRLGELRLAALEERIDADLANGRHGDLVSELEALIVDRPLRERGAQLMLGLYRSGRQAAALHAGLAPDDPGTRFRWSLTGAGS